MQFQKSLKIICLTEESVETLFLLGKGSQIQGVSSFVKRPLEATKLPKVSLFTSSKIDTIVKMQPDLVVGYSDIQKDIARDLIEQGLNVWISNHRSLSETLSYIYHLALLVDAKEQGIKLIDQLQHKIEKAKAFALNLKTRPKVYFEEWDEPMISAIEWVSELIELCGGESVTGSFSKAKLAKDRIVTSEFIIEQNPDIIFGCWCGKKVKIPKILERQNWDCISAIKNHQVFELEPEIFLQPGPAVILDGIDILIDYFSKWSENQ
jgi:iron complex transport system substrate-binding protein